MTVNDILTMPLW